ncbi:hypothetical protein KUV47_20670 [Vannielia litorea]|uniref:hypothetical protein n=1 Tax=Vannielia litorea TaxID=1217970 RepID=UPI001C970C71|nr:hypothetical protein [Vannielia litorea]MBY6155642.1 hypothetical protein [Vannielia litorea]
MSPYRPAPPDRPPQTLAALRDWMVAEGANFGSYALDGRAIGEGHSVRHDGTEWLWGYEARGAWRELARFGSEAELAAHAYAQIAGDAWAWTHPLIMTPDRDEARRVELACRERGEPVFRDSIPYGGPQDLRHRVFVFGRAIERVQDLKPKVWF